VAPSRQRLNYILCANLLRIYFRCAMESELSQVVFIVGEIHHITLVNHAVYASVWGSLSFEAMRLQITTLEQSAEYHKVRYQQ